MIKNLIKKEWLDIKRDRKLLLGSIILPLILLPLVGIILFAATVYQPPTVDIVNQNVNNTKYVTELSNYIKNNGGITYINSSKPADIQIIFPPQFYENITSLNRTAIVYISYIISSRSEALSLVENGLYQILYNTSLNRIHKIETTANINISPVAIREPLEVELLYKLPSGKAVSQSQDEFSQLARIIAILIFPAATPVIYFVTDSIMGEKERKTLESLLASPISSSSFIFSKLTISLILGLISSIGDLIGLVVFSLFAPLIVGQGFQLSFAFTGLVVLVYLIMILLTASLTILVLVFLGGSSRNVQIINFIITSFGMIASFSSLFINFGDLTFPFSLILGIPFVQLVASLLFYVFGLIQESIFSILVTFVVSILLLLIASRFLDSERLLLK
ncbi:ABC transporter permease [Acidianus manzaensis]|uniref:Sodium ABC transporter permease n=1 Tax=Acidianus manzaensis TaxID=282676 RepID=A0A1W6JY30_9CREN|nr:ABC transporter permease [Acidianus manzaensis]ARM75120.1 sodium ABC transporter permease [Acidianus manzaensis]